MAEASGDDARGKLVIIGLNYTPEPIGIGPYTAGLAEDLVSRGWLVRTITGRPYYPDWQAFPNSSPFWSSRRENGVNVIRCPHYIPRKPNGFRRLLHHISFALSALFPALAMIWIRPKLIIAIAPSLMSAPIGRLAAWLCGAKFWIHVQDLELDAALATGLIGKDRAGLRIARAIEQAIFRSADQISSISPQMCEKLRDKGIPHQQVAELRNWATQDRVPAQPHHATYRSDWGLDGRKVALYSGNIANKQGLPIVIEAARILADRKDIAFVICGQGPNRNALEHSAAMLPNLQFHDLQPAERLGELLALADVHLLPQLADAADLVLPSKLTNMLASGKPIVATAAKGTGLAQEIEGCGIAVPPGDAELLAQAITRLVDKPELAAQYGQAASLRAAQHWSKPVIMRQWQQALTKLFDRAR